MTIYIDPDAYVGTSEHYTCSFHRANPDIASYAGCTCSASWGQRPAQPKKSAGLIVNAVSTENAVSLNGTAGISRAKAKGG